MNIGYGGVPNATVRRLHPPVPVPVRKTAARPSAATDEERDEKCQQL
jgi:hypothetical protein